MSMNNTYQTSDLYCAAALIASGCDLVDIDSTNRRCVFVFKDEESVETVAKKYWAREMMLEPFSLFSAHKYLKTRIYHG